jgi:hypothetical protein
MQNTKLPKAMPHMSLPVFQFFGHFSFSPVSGFVRNYSAPAKIIRGATKRQRQRLQHIVTLLFSGRKIAANPKKCNCSAPCKNPRIQAHYSA